MRLVVSVALVAALALTAGCVGLGGSDGGAPTPTPSPSTATDACETDLLLTDSGTEAVTPKPMPGSPASLDAESVGRFAQSYERAFAHNHALGDRVTDVAVELQGTTVRAAAGGHRVRIHVWTRTTVASPAATAGDGQAEATVEESFYDAHYYVSEETLRRGETERHGTLPDGDLAGSGVTLACWSG
ncbi:hypothetical protein [Halosimplex pelagicum]|uniref:Lipoprotein n=1 Tax=Halosimplex pelagicum TaxID=869886 RepID=A0A7D5TIR3_9EURY|nr:hypothetical protein [Halosimplex pelagicum]QLH84156.1 hypothetical protein HZS54_22070 [Halosimplex pelagicum]